MIALSAVWSWGIVLFLAAFWIFIFALMKTAKRADEEAEQWPTNIFDDAVWSEWDEEYEQSGPICQFCTFTDTRRNVNPRCPIHGGISK